MISPSPNLRAFFSTWFLSYGFVLVLAVAWGAPARGMSDAELAADVALHAAPGTHYAYSNFGFMLLSYALARQAESADIESLLRERLFVPLGMSGAYVAKRPKAVRAATGHTPHDAKATAAWSFAPRMAGVGGVRATLDDMLCYLQAHLAAAAEPLASPGEESVSGRTAALSALRLSQERLHGSPALAMAWMQGQLGRERLLFHGGTTGGFSAHIAFLPELGRGVVLLSDTSLGTVGGLENLALHLLDSRVPLDPPRQRAEPAPELLTALAGRYQLRGAMRFVLYQ